MAMLNMSEISPQNSSPMAGLLPSAQYAWLMIDGSTSSVSGSLSSPGPGMSGGDITLNKVTL